MNETGEKLPEALITTPAHKELEASVVAPEEGADKDAVLGEDVALELESDGDVFWLIQRVLWGILKLVVILSVIAGIVWLIWGEMPHGGVNTKKKSTGTETSSQKTEPKKVPEKVVEKGAPIVHQPVLRSNENIRTDGALVGVGWNYWIENRCLAEQKNTVSEALSWNKQAAAFFDTPLPKLIAGDSPVIRSRNFDRVVSENYKLMENALPIRSKLEFQSSDFSKKAEAEKIEYEKYKQALGRLLKDSNPSYFDETWVQMMASEKRSIEYLREMQLRQQLVQSMGRYYLGLKDSYEMLMANERAIVENIQVVNFPWDPFGRVISPTQWRSGQAN
jgi:hypothetical protein